MAMNSVPFEFRAWTQPIELTTSGRLQLLPGEVELVSVPTPSCDFYVGEKNPIIKSFSCTITSLRVVLRDPSSASPLDGFAIPLSCISSVGSSGGGLFSRPKIRLNLRPLTQFLSRHISFCVGYRATLGKHQEAFDASGGPSYAFTLPGSSFPPLPRVLPSELESVALFGLSVTRDGISDETPGPGYFCINLPKSVRDLAVDQARRALVTVHSALLKALNRELLETVARLEGMDPNKLALQRPQRDVNSPSQSQHQSQSQNAVNSSSNSNTNANTNTTIGIGAILKRKEAERAETDDALQGAVSDLESLMTQAQKVVQLTERLVAEKERKRARLATSAAVSSDSNTTPDTEDYDDIVRSLSISSMVSKAGTGDAFHQELAKELADTLPEPIRRLGGVLALPDVYCLVSKMRGTELISPEDLLAAAQLWDPLGLPLHLRRFSHSGVYVVQLEEFSQERIQQRVANAVRGNTMGSIEAAASEEKRKALRQKAEAIGMIPFEASSSRSNSQTNETNVMTSEPLLGCVLEENVSQEAWKGKGISAIELAKLVNIPLPLLRQELYVMVVQTGVLAIDVAEGTTRYYYNYLPSLFLEHALDSTKTDTVHV